MTDSANVARMYDVFRGVRGQGFAVDRLAAEAVMDASPGVRRAARENRRFLKRAVNVCALSGLEQFLDLGSGLPGEHSVYRQVRRHLPHARIVAVDCDEAVVQAIRWDFSRRSDQRARAVKLDVTRADMVVNHPEVRRLIDFTRPLVVIMGALLHFVPDDQKPHAVVAGYRTVMAPGSLLVLSHATCDGADDAVFTAREVYQQHATELVLRTRRQVVRFFDGFTVWASGVVDAVGWCPAADPDPDTGEGTDRQGEPSFVLAGVGMRPYPVDSPARVSVEALVGVS